MITANKNIFAVTLGFFILSFFCLINFTFAASIIPIPTQIPDLEEQIEATIEPRFPKPGDTVKITLEAYGTDLNNSNIIWSTNGKVVQQGSGSKTFSLIASIAGQPTTITVTIAPPNSKIVTKTFIIDPQTVDLIWEAHTYTPPFYKGKAMYTPQEKITFVAMPNIINKSGSFVPPNTVTYKWSQNGTVMGDYSGYGIQSFYHKGSILMTPVDINVEAKAPDGSIAKNYLTLSPASPEIAFYENNSLYGILFNTEISNGFDFGDKEERSVSAFPYFFNGDTKANYYLSYKWAINGNPINVPTNQTGMTFRNTENLEGRSIIGVTVNNVSNFLQSASNAMIINFQKPKKVFSF